VSDDLLSIGELAARTNVAVTALRYYDELGLVRPATRASGQRRYAESAVSEVGVVLFLREVGFTLAEIAQLLATTGSRTECGSKAGVRTPAFEPHSVGWSDLVERKLAELAEQQHRLLVARTALEHARDCPAGDPSRCPRFWAIIDARLSGDSLEDSHAAVH
jgi:DNA-binding transcriptional MerR regulator